MQAVQLFAEPALGSNTIAREGGNVHFWGTFAAVHVVSFLVVRLSKNDSVVNHLEYLCLYADRADFTRDPLTVHVLDPTESCHRDWRLTRA